MWPGTHPLNTQVPACIPLHSTGARTHARTHTHARACTHSNTHTHTRTNTFVLACILKRTHVHALKHTQCVVPLLPPPSDT